MTTFAIFRENIFQKIDVICRRDYAVKINIKIIKVTLFIVGLVLLGGAVAIPQLSAGKTFLQDMFVVEKRRWVPRNLPPQQLVVGKIGSARPIME